MDKMNLSLSTHKAAISRLKLFHHRYKKIIRIIIGVSILLLLDLFIPTQQFLTTQSGNSITSYGKGLGSGLTGLTSINNRLDPFMSVIDYWAHPVYASSFYLQGIYSDPFYDYKFNYPGSWIVKRTNYTGYLETVSFYVGDQEKLIIYLDQNPTGVSSASERSTLLAKQMFLPGGQNRPQVIITFATSRLTFMLEYLPDPSDKALVDDILSTFQVGGLSVSLADGSRASLEIPQAVSDNCLTDTINGWPAWGSVIIPGSNWNGVNVYSNGGDYNDACSSTYGYQYQCVELVQRLFSQWINVSIWPNVTSAYQMFANHPSGTTAISNGGSPGPQWGDALVFSGGPNGYGHAAAISSVSNNQVTIVEQNFNPNATRTLSMSGTTISNPSGYTVLGWVHANANNSGGSSAPSLNSPSDSHDLAKE